MLNNQQEEQLVSSAGKFTIGWDGESKILKGTMHGALNDELAFIIRNESLKMLSASEIKWRFFCDLREAKGVPSAKVRSILKELSRHPNLEKMAYLISSATIKKIANLIIRTSGAQNHKIFSNEAKALEWLTKSK